MRTIKLYTLSAAAGLLLAGVAHADDSALFARGGYAAESQPQRRCPARTREQCRTALDLSHRDRNRHGFRVEKSDSVSPSSVPRSARASASRPKRV